MWSFDIFEEETLSFSISVYLFFSCLKEAATSLFIASQYGYVDIVRELISFRSSLNAPLQVSMYIIIIILFLIG